MAESATEATLAPVSLYPLRGMVLIAPQAPVLQTATGIHLVHDPGPATAGTILACGPEVDPDLQIGHLVLFSPHVGQEVQVGEQTCLLVPDTDLSAIVTTQPTACPSCGRPLEP